MAARSANVNNRPGNSTNASYNASHHQNMHRNTMNYPPASDSPRPSSVGSAQSNHSGSNFSTKGGHGPPVCVGEEFKIAVDASLERFRLSEEQQELEFPSSLTSTERAYIHRLCQSMGLTSKSKGKGASRYLTVRKKTGTQAVRADAVLNLARNSRHQIQSLIQRFPITNKERQDLQPRTERGQYNEGVYRELNKTTTGRLNNGVPQVPPARGSSELTSFRQGLPVYALKDKIIKSINEHKVVLISGETGCGKTTQVPQMILDDSQAQNKPCRIFCTQPRRLSALSVAERVAAERGEKIGQTVGYQIRLESRVSPKTLLTFCTNGVLLRTLMGGESGLSTVTHIIVDEIHERDRFSDFLLICLKDIIPKQRNLKVVLMSAALNIQLFANYFGSCPIFQVPGRCYEVKEFYLEDVLRLTGFTNSAMEKYKKELSKVAGQQKQLDAWCSKTSAEQQRVAEKKEDSEPKELEGSKTFELGEEKEELEPWLTKEMDELLSECFLTGNEDIFSQIFHLILSENVSVDYTHSETSATPLMIAAGRGFLTIVEQLLNLGANVQMKASNGWSALDWARKFDHTDIIELLEANMNVVTSSLGQDESLLVQQSSRLSAEDKELLNIYHHSFDDSKVDLDLLAELLHKVHSSQQEGAILVFLPGYDEIVGLREKIYDDKRFSDGNKFILYVLHSAMQSSDQKRVFKATPPGVRKIILSTNLAETSVTINDVVFVIDSGKVKEKTFDALSSVSMLKSTWISKASLLQRRGRAGRCRPGVAYHLVSRVRFESLQEYQDPEILRYPLQELCLHTKLLAPTNCPIADFIAKAPEAPPFLITRNAVHILKQMDALDAFEELTELGHHLADLPVEPRYGKMVLYAVVLKCLDPVLTIACSLAYRDPFILPNSPYHKRQAAMSKRKFAAGTFSDHMALLRAFQSWQRAKTEGWERSLCEKNFLSASTMEMIFGMRTQLLGQLRASGFVRARGGGDIRDLNTNAENWAVVKAALCAGMYPQVVRVDRLDKNHAKLTTMKQTRVRFHTTSVLAPAPNQLGTDTHALAMSRLPTDWLVFEEMMRAHRMAHVRCCTVVTPSTVSIFSGPAKLPQDAVREAELGVQAGGGDGITEMSSDSEGEEKDDSKRTRYRLDDWIQFKCEPEVASLSMNLRQKWHSLFIRRMRAPSKPWSQVDENVIRTVISVLTNEEQALGLQQPAGIGQRPRPMSTEGMVAGSGGSRRGSYDTEPQSDDSSTNSSSGGHSTPKGRSPKVGAAPPKRKDLAKLTKGSSEERSETSSVRSSSSANNSGTSSLRGSAASSPCHSPQPGSPSKTPTTSSSGPITSTTTTTSTTSSSPSTCSPSMEKDVLALSAAHPHPCRYLVMKCSTIKQLDVSQSKGIWATTASNEKKISKMFQDGKVVYLVFSVQGSGHFQGYSRVTSMTPQERVREFASAGLMPPFQVEWIKRGNLPFQHTHTLLNPWNENKRVQIARDGQEVEPTVGESLVKLWERIPAYVIKNSPQSARFGKNYTPGGNDHSNNSGGPESKQGSPSQPSSRGSWGSGSPQGHDGGKGSGPWGSRGSGNGMGGGGFPGGQQHTSPQHGPPVGLPPHMSPPFNPMYMPHGMPQGQMFPPGQNMSPVMILQRGQGHHGPRSSHGHSNNNSGGTGGGGGGYSGQGSNSYGKRSK